MPLNPAAEIIWNPIEGRFMDPLTPPKIPNGPELWEKLLSAVEEIFECDCCVAGGAIRDYVIGIPPKDIDIFVDIAFPDLLEKHHPELNWGEAYRPRGTKTYRKTDSAVKDCWEFPDVFGYSVNLIAKACPVEDYASALIETFDFGIVKCFFTVKGGMYITDECEKDIREKTFTYYDTPRTWKSKVRFERFIKRTGLPFTLVGYPEEEMKLTVPSDPIYTEVVWTLNDTANRNRWNIR